MCGKEVGACQSPSPSRDRVPSGPGALDVHPVFSAPGPEGTPSRLCLKQFRGGADARGASWYIQKVIQSAVVPVAGLGTRLLPATRSQPKEMLPVARKPVVEYVVDELAANGIEQIPIGTGCNKTSIEDHFDLGAHESAAPTKFFYTRQGSPKGLGDAALAGAHLGGQQPFVVALGDSILGLHAQSQAVSRMI